MRRVAVINVVGLTRTLIGQHTPQIAAFMNRGTAVEIAPAFPAVTCTAQSAYLTGATPAVHGIVGNGWYDRELAEVQFWKQSNHLVAGSKLWEELRRIEPKCTCAKLFWWFNMYSTADYSITPRPMYPADGRKIFDIYTWPYSIADGVKRELGEFPFPAFWGPAAGVRSRLGAPDAASRWIAESAKWIEREHRPTLSLIYLPHLDYNLQRFGPTSREALSQQVGVETSGHPAPASDTNASRLNSTAIQDLAGIDDIVGGLLDFLSQRNVEPLLLSEYGITQVDQPVHLNRLFREKGWLTTKHQLGWELLDCGASRAFAVADHQVAHIYLNDPALAAPVRQLLEMQSGVEHVLDKTEQAALGLDHPRSGDLVAAADERSWFTYYYWLDDARAPDFARTVDIHRKPGYDPVELFLDPALKFPNLRIAWRMLQKKLGFRMLLDVIPLDSSLVQGSHGRRPANQMDWPLLISSQPALMPAGPIEATDVFHILKRHVLEGS